VGKCLSCNVGESFEKFLEPDTEAGNFQNLINSSSSRDTSLVKFHKDLIRKVYNNQIEMRALHKQKSAHDVGSVHTLFEYAATDI